MSLRRSSLKKCCSTACAAQRALHVPTTRNIKHGARRAASAWKLLLNSLRRSKTNQTWADEPHCEASTPVGACGSAVRSVTPLVRTDRRWISRRTALAAARSCSTTPRSSRSSRRRDRPRARSSCRSDPFALSFSLRPSLHALGCAAAVGAIIADDAARARLGSTGCVEQREAA